MKVWTASIVVIAGVLSNADAARAQECAAEPVVARGEQARYEWLAKTKARANWRRKVRELPGLGTTFSNWSAARDTQERCIETERAHYCIFSGIPCRR
ncbi:MAG: hypothetical protein R3D68_07410 [Hyphomicrobiaceae bacterium]